MKILVIDDNPENIESAKKLFKEHELTTISDVDNAVKELSVQYDEDKEKELINGGMKWKEALEKSKLPFAYDVVLIDLMMPASGYMLSDKAKYAGQEMPYGFALAIMAAKNGAKKVAVATSMDHHQHPMSAVVDYLDSESGLIKIADADVAFLQIPDYHKPSKPKDWKRAMEVLMGKKTDPEEEDEETIGA